ncbi:MAG: phage Gp37/Gp68 family protein [Ignavibacteria bacterium]|nr:phage Gp37/Gp68 family protein [Ignavibacteria bacterium]
MSDSKIEWTEVTWNPTTGCSKISAGCTNCYAELFAKRLQAIGAEKYKNGFKLTLHPDVLIEPKKYKTPRIIFVSSMSDVFHKDIPLSFLKKIFEVMNETPRHIYQVLTKRAERMEKLAGELRWTENIWLGVTVENEKARYRIEHLRRVPAKIKFLSMEPLLEAVPDINLEGIDWVIVGGESGPKARPIKEEWILEIKNACEKYNAAFCFKQWGGFNKKANGRLLQGKIYDAIPNPYTNQHSLF